MQCSISAFGTSRLALRTAECVKEGEREGRETDGETQRQIETGRNKKKEGAE